MFDLNLRNTSLITVIGFVALTLLAAFFVRPTHANMLRLTEENCEEIVPTINSDYYRVIRSDGQVLLTNVNDIDALCGTITISNPDTCFADAEIVPTVNDDYYRVIQTDGQVLLVHVNDFDGACGTEDNEYTAVVPDESFCDDDAEIVPTVNEDFYRVILSDGTIMIIQSEQLLYCMITV